MARQTRDRSIGEDSLEKRARALAEWFHVNCEQMLLVLQKLAKELPSLDASKPDLDYVAGIVREALLALPCEQALELFQVTPAGDLEERIWVAHYLCGESDEGDLPLFSRDELAATIEDFRDFLASQRMHLLETGLPSDDFARCRWLDDRLVRLYPIRRTKLPFPADRPAQFPRIVSPPGSLRTKSDADGPETVNASCGLQNGDLVTGISMADAERLISLRPKILDLKLDVLGNAARFLRLPKHGDSFWNVCFSHVRTTLSDDEVIFWTKMDAVYADNLKMWKAAGPFVSFMTGNTFPFQPSGLTETIEFIGHVEKECAIGTMHETRKALGDLVAIKESGPRLLATGPWPYFELVGLQEQPKLDEAIRVFQECADREADFWPDFRNRVENDLVGKLEPIVTISFRANAADMLGSIGQAYVDWAKSHMLATDSLPVPHPTPPQQVAAEPSASKRYVFEFVDPYWEIKFGTGRRNLFPSHDGFLYLHVLLDKPGHGFTPMALSAAKDKFLDRQGSRSIRPLPELLESRGDESTHDSSIASKDVGEFVDAEGRDAYQEGLNDVRAELATARANNDAAEISRLEKVEAMIQSQLKAAADVGGQIKCRSLTYKNAQDRVRNAIDRAIERIGKKDGILANHLRLTWESDSLFKYLPEKDKRLAEKPDWNR